MLYLRRGDENQPPDKYSTLQILLRTHIFFRTNSFIHRRFDTQTLLHTYSFTHKHLFTGTLLHTDAFTYRGFYIQTL